MQSLTVTTVLALSISTAACAIDHQPETSITLIQAMRDVASGLNEMYEIRAKSPKSGLLPAEAEIVFNISSKTTHDGKLYMEAGANVTDVLKVAKVGGEAGSKIEASRGNQITVKFTNILFAPRGTFLSDAKYWDKGPRETIDGVFRAVEDHVGIMLGTGTPASDRK